MKAGYKGTDIGIIPFDWSECTVGQLIEFEGGSQPSKSTFSVSPRPGYVRLIQIRDYKTDRFEVFAPSSLLRRFCDASDIMIGRYGPPVFQILRGISGAYNVALIKAKPQEGIDRNYAYYFLKQDTLFAFIDKLSRRSSGQTGVDLTELRGYPLPLPPLPEQRAIATALSDVDALLGALDRLIAKKRDLKQAAMQQLLTGQTRLPGFHGEWEVKRLGEICEIEMGRTPPRMNQAFWGRGYVWLSIADLQSKVVSRSKEEVTELGASTMAIIPKGTLLMSFKLSIGRLCFAGCDLFTNEAICSFNNLRASSDFLYYALGRVDFSLYGKQAVKGYTLNKESLKVVEVRLPPLPEQTAITQVLSDMDAELAALEAQRTKTRALKQGMMQELLTGKTRLV